MRSMILSVACSHGHEESNQNAKKLFMDNLNG